MHFNHLVFHLYLSSVLKENWVSVFWHNHFNMFIFHRSLNTALASRGMGSVLRQLYNLIIQLPNFSIFIILLTRSFFVLLVVFFIFKLSSLSPATSGLKLRRH